MRQKKKMTNKSELRKHLDRIDAEQELILSQFEDAIGAKDLELSKFHIERFKIYADQRKKIADALEAKFKEMFGDGK